MAEGLARQEEITHEQALTDLLNKEQKTLRECLVYLAWLDQRMARLDEATFKNRAERGEAEFFLILEDARLRFEAGRISSARSAYEDALFQAERTENRTPKMVVQIPHIKKEMKALPDGRGVTRRREDE